jgi:hypothetical protein
MMDGGFHLKSAPKLSNQWGPLQLIEMKERKEIMMDNNKEKSSLFSRRNFITKLGIFLAGGIAGHGTSFASTPTPTAAAAPPLPWKWVKLDPLEAGRRAFRAYLEHKG